MNILEMYEKIWIQANTGCSKYVWYRLGVVKQKYIMNYAFKYMKNEDILNILVYKRFCLSVLS